MKTTVRRLLPAAASLLLVSPPVLAHTGATAVDGLAAGVAHPLGGLDHLAAMLAVGLLAGSMPRSDAWRGPVVFVLAMLAGALLAAAGVAVPAVESGIALSVLVLGVMLALHLRNAGTGMLLLVGGFALLHGHAHGTEASGSLVPYLAGFAITTSALHVAGIAMARRLAGLRPVLTALGVACAAGGAALLAGAGA